MFFYCAFCELFYSPDLSVDLGSYVHSVKGSYPGVTKVTRSLLLDSDTQIKVYFTVDNSFSAPASVNVNGVSTKLNKETDGIYSVVIPSIAAHNLGAAYPITMGSMSISTSAMAYARDAIASAGVKQSMKEAVAALYRYYSCALAYQSAHSAN